MAYHGDSPAFYVINQPQAQPVVKGNPFEQADSEWTAGICDCFDDVGQCCYAYFCWCCFVRSLGKKIGEKSCCNCCVTNRLGIYRMKIRTALHIRGDAVDDCCTVYWFPFCAGLQMYNELKNRGLA